LNISRCLGHIYRKFKGARDRINPQLARRRAHMCGSQAHLYYTNTRSEFTEAEEKDVDTRCAVCDTTPQGQWASQAAPDIVTEIPRGLGIGLTSSLTGVALKCVGRTRTYIIRKTKSEFT